MIQALWANNIILGEIHEGVPRPEYPSPCWESFATNWEREWLTHEFLSIRYQGSQTVPDLIHEIIKRCTFVFSLIKAHVASVMRCHNAWRNDMSKPARDL
jgi:hypothetical protein